MAAPPANSKRSKSPRLKASIVEPILACCSDECSMLELQWKVQTTQPLPYTLLKRYLFYLIIYDLLSYNGQRQSFTTEDVGFDLLHMIRREKKSAMADSEDIVIMIE